MESRTPGFDELVDLAYDAASRGPLEDPALDALWKALFGLETWYFLAKPPEADDELVPFVCDGDDGCGWLLAFTDLGRLRRYCSQEGLEGEGQIEGETFYLSLKPASARAWVRGLPDEIGGIRFNEGEHGWQGDRGSIDRIHEHLYPRDPESAEGATTA